ncbi:MAG: hypothetical protein H6613_02040 [Ignavibacteriales bacterium]|nr:hypothetical protein [Ignavibacteriales bacterium]
MESMLGNGYYGELLVSFINSFYVFGSYQRLDDDPKSGILNLRADISPEGGSYVARAGYDKINIQDEKIYLLLIIVLIYLLKLDTNRVHIYLYQWFIIGLSNQLEI